MKSSSTTRMNHARYPHDTAWRLLGCLCLCMTLAITMSMTTRVMAQDQAKVASDSKDTKETKGKGDITEPSQMIIDDQAVNLRPMFEAGRNSKYSFWSQRDRTVNVSFNGDQQSTSVRMVFEGQVSWTVKSVAPDGSARCIMNYEHVLAKIQNGDEPPQVVDSRQGAGENAQLHKFLTSLVNAPIEVQMTAEGVAQSVTGTQLITQRLGEDLKAMAPEDEEHVESAMELATLPGAPATLPVGQSWSADYDWKHELGRNKMKMTYQLAQVEDIAGIPVATINTSAKPVIVPDYSKIPANGPKVNIQQTQGDYQGQIIFDLQRHDTVGSNAVKTTAMVITISLPNNQTIIRNVDEKLQSQMLRIEEAK